MSVEDKPENIHNQRDGETLIALGLFMVVLSIPVLLGTYFEDAGLARFVNIGCSFILFAIGAAFGIHGKRKLKKN